MMTIRGASAEGPRSRRRRTLLLSPVLAALLLLGLSPVRAQSQTKADWPTFGKDLARTGHNPSETVLGGRNAANLRQRWSTSDLGAVINASAVVASNVRVGGALRDLVYIGTEHGEFFALDAASGQVVWHRNLGSVNTAAVFAKACRDVPDGIFGVTGTPVVDRTSSRLYVAGGDARVYALDLASGAIAPGWPVSFGANPRQVHVYGGLTLANGLLYVAAGSYCDEVPYHGQLAALAVATRRVVAHFYPVVASGKPSGGGIWGSGGASVDATGDVYVATGNAEAKDQHAYYAEHVIRLSRTLAVKAANYPGVVGPDTDLGSTPVLYQPRGCPPELVVENKHGVLALYHRDRIASGPIQKLQVIRPTGKGSFIGDAAYSPATNMVYVVDSLGSIGPYSNGMLAFRIQADCTLGLAWKQPTPTGVTSSPTVANGVVYFGNGAGSTLYAFDALSGKVLWTSGATISGGVFSTPIVVNGVLYAAGYDHRLHAFAA